jgi:toxin ParE1/3/4
MASRRIFKSPEADGDLAAIWSYIAKDSEAAATRMLHSIDAAIRTLAYAPYRGEPQPDFGEDVRRIIVGNYVIYYEVHEDVHIMRVFHGAQKWEDLL